MSESHKRERASEAEAEAKAPRIETTSEVAGGDLTVLVEGASIVVHSLVLTLASPVFGAMLSSKMQEGLDKQIDLKGKAKAEFHAFWTFLQPGNFEPITAENAHFLLRWADEYQVEGLKRRCEEYLIAKEVPRQPEQINLSLQEAVVYRLELRKSQILKLIKADMPRSLGSLGSITPETAACLRDLWPQLCQAAAVACPDKERPTVESIMAMWPFIAASLRCCAPAKRFEEFRREAVMWPRVLEQNLARHQPASDRPKACREQLSAKLERFLRD
ncbi:unnamed protein product [Effrenium voratum]|nr:unnamed protein product [Effrenium voratum]